ncbi:hypothetical protein FA95DRAFT_884187 [Auriscalpium vulgare]|uniref:Uncharacterized protein n=1 Tax=Auriscalpium vulgare TaxID=40419 RepID=A0ACB8R901_9AGAM|nr:hypothetical protein FA95DRAFT_884187 [Auriscalpium vulgare]
MQWTNGNGAPDTDSIREGRGWQRPLESPFYFLNFRYISAGASTSAITTEDMSSALPSLDSTMGGLYIGILVSGALWGVTTMQTWHYYREYPQDPWHIKALVAVVFVLDTLHQMLIAHTGYWYLVTHYFEPQFLGRIVWSIAAEVAVAAIVALIVQCFFIKRIWKFSKKNPIIVGIVSVLALSQFLVTVVYLARVFSRDLWTYPKLATIKGLSMSVNATTVAADASIALMLCYLLQSSRTGFRRSDTVINKLILFAANTGLITSMDAVCSLITIAALPNTFIYISFFFAQSRLYSNSLMATLNARNSLRNNLDSEGLISLTAMAGRSAATTAPSFHPMGIRSQTNNVAIRIDTMTESNGDDANTDTKFDDRKDNTTVIPA